MKPPPKIVIGVAWALLAVTALSAVTTMAALNNGGEIGVGPLRFRLAAGYDRVADRLVAQSPTAADLDAADALGRRALALFPYDNRAWLRLAYADSLRPAGLSARGVQALETSYALIALDPSHAKWRIQFCLQNWLQLSPTVRKAVEVEFDALARSPSHQSTLDVPLKAVTDPVGRVVAAYWLARLQTLRATSARSLRTRETVMQTE